MLVSGLPSLPVRFAAVSKTLSSETANRHLEDLDILFATESPLVWRAEKEFKRRKAQSSTVPQEIDPVS